MKRKLLIPLSVVILLGTTYLLGYSTFFTVSSIEIKGSSRPISSGITIGQKLARVEPRSIASKLESLDWVESADISRNWINGKVTIQLNQRTPVAIYKNQVIDASGKSFIAQGKSSKGLIQLQAASITDATKAVGFLKQLPTDIRKTLFEIKLRSSGAYVLIVENNGKTLELRWGTNSENDLKTRVYKALVALPENAQITRVDVSAPHAPIVK